MRHVKTQQDGPEHDETIAEIQAAIERSISHNESVDISAEIQLVLLELEIAGYPENNCDCENDGRIFVSAWSPGSDETEVSLMVTCARTIAEQAAEEKRMDDEDAMAEEALESMSPIPGAGLEQKMKWDTVIIQAIEQSIAQDEAVMVEAPLSRAIDILRWGSAETKGFEVDHRDLGDGRYDVWAWSDGSPEGEMAVRLTVREPS